MSKHPDKNDAELILQGGQVAQAQNTELSDIEVQSVQIRNVMTEVEKQEQAQDSELNRLMKQMNLLEESLTDLSTASEFDLQESYVPVEIKPDIAYIQTVPLLSEDSWKAYLGSVEHYAQIRKLDLSGDPFLKLMSKSDQDKFAEQVRQDFYEEKPNCDSIDYAIAAFSGVIGGLVDIFCVGMPGDGSPLGNWVDQQTNKITEQVGHALWKHDDAVRQNIREYAKAHGLSTDERNMLLKKAGIPTQNLVKEPKDLKQAIQYLESKYRVNYDATGSKDFDLSGLSVEEAEKIKNQFKDMTPKNHHIKSLAHAPDIVGLIFSVLDQFTGKASFVADGKIIRIVPISPQNPLNKFELRGSNLVSKIFCGIVNWLGHCISDIAGSHSSKTRGMGLPIPGFELLQFINIGKFEVQSGNKTTELTLAQLSIKVFENGYDARFGIAQSIPVMITELLTRMSFAIKQYFYEHRPLKECVPLDIKTAKLSHQPKLRRMLLTAHGVLCSFDAVDALVQSGGNPVLSVLHLNFIAYVRLSQIGLSEIRGIYRQNHIDMKEIKKKTEHDWQELYINAIKWTPSSLLYT